MTSPTPSPLTQPDETFLRRALRLAMNGRGRVEPNPMVGCVLVKNGQIIAEGWHTHFGGPHAEPAALADAKARGHDPRGATAYVTLEPCCHTNKKTPPCAPRLIEAGIARVVIGCLDPNPDVNGQGVAMLRAAGIDVVVAGAELAHDFQQLIAPFVQRTAGTGPYMTLKWAEDVQGYVAGPLGARSAISGPLANKVVHRLRARVDAIMVGIMTALNDNPNLLPRGVETPCTPVRVVLDTALRLRVRSQVVRTIDQGPVLVYSGVEWRDDRTHHRKELQAAGVEIYDDIRHDALHHLRLDDLRRDWSTRGWTHLLVEPGPTLARTLLPVADRLWVIRSPAKIGDGSAPDAASIPRAYVETGRLALGPDTLIEYLNRDAASFVTATPSADFVLEADAAANPKI